MEEQRLAAEHAHDDDDDADSGVKKSPSEFSCGSVEVYIPPGGGGGHGGGHHGGGKDDKERISIKSETCADGVRRLSIVNSRGKKVTSSQSPVAVNVLSIPCSRSDHLVPQSKHVLYMNLYSQYTAWGVDTACSGPFLFHR